MYQWYQIQSIKIIFDLCHEMKAQNVTPNIQIMGTLMKLANLILRSRPDAVFPYLFNRASTHETKVGRNSKMTDFDQTLLVWPTHGWGWPPTTFLVWGHPCGRGSPTLGLILLVNPKFHVVARIGLEWSICYIFINALMGNFRFGGCRSIFWRGPSLKKFSEISAF